MSDFLGGLAEHLRTHAVRTDGPFTLASGAVSPWYIDARRTTFDGAGATSVGRAVIASLHPGVVAVGGMTMGADPMAVAAAIVAAGEGRDLRAFSIRKAPKDHGTGGRLVGAVRRGDAVAILEDTTTTGSALLEAISVAAEAGLEVVQAIALVDRSGGVVGEALSDRGIPYRSLVSLEDLGL